MARLKFFAIFFAIFIAFYLYSNALIYIWLHPEEVGGKIYNLTHKEKIVIEEKSNVNTKTE